MIIIEPAQKYNPEYFTKSRPKFLRIRQKRCASYEAHPNFLIIIKLWRDTRLYVYRSSAHRQSHRTAVH